MEINNTQFKELVQENKGELIIVDFFANWCGPCRMLGPVIEEVCDEHNIKLYKVNTDDNQQLAQRNGVMALPTVLFFRDGEEIDRFVGFRPKEAIEEILIQYK